MSTKNTQLVSIGDRIREERERMSLTQAECAAKGGVSTRSQLAYEQGATAASCDYLAKLALEGMDIGWVLTGRTPSIHQLWSNKRLGITAIEGYGPNGKGLVQVRRGEGLGGASNLDSRIKLAAELAQQIADLLHSDDGQRE